MYLDNSKEIKIRYFFRFNDESKIELNLTLNPEDLSIIEPKIEKFPEWAELKNFKCSHCPLNELEVKYCPLALRIQTILSLFNNRISFEEVDVFVETPIRNYSKTTTLQAGVSSLLGIFMVASGCPVMGKLKPLLYFHLPFASVTETEIRALSIYLLAQFVKKIKGEQPDWDMKKLKDIYDDVRLLNYNVSRNIVNLAEKDASINSLIILNNFAEFVSLLLDEKIIDELEFYLKDFF